jgi:hypothetical protein
MKKSKEERERDKDKEKDRENIEFYIDHQRFPNVLYEKRQQVASFSLFVYL